MFNLGDSGALTRFGETPNFRLGVLGLDFVWSPMWVKSPYLVDDSAAHYQSPDDNDNSSRLGSGSAVLHLQLANWAVLVLLFAFNSFIT